MAPGRISEEKNKVFRSMMPIDPSHVVRGQFLGYRQEPGVDAESDTETFIAVKCIIDNWRRAGVGSHSFFEPASAWPRASASYRSHSANRRRACFRAIPASDWPGLIT